MTRWHLRPRPGRPPSEAPPPAPPAAPPPAPAPLLLDRKPPPDRRLPRREPSPCSCPVALTRSSHPSSTHPCSPAHAPRFLPTSHRPASRSAAWPPTPPETVSAVAPRPRAARPAPITLSDRPDPDLGHPHFRCTPPGACVAPHASWCMPAGPCLRLHPFRRLTSTASVPARRLHCTRLRHHPRPHDPTTTASFTATPSSRCSFAFTPVCSNTAVPITVQVTRCVCMRQPLKFTPSRNTTNLTLEHHHVVIHLRNAGSPQRRRLGLKPHPSRLGPAQPAIPTGAHTVSLAALW